MGELTEESAAAVAWWRKWNKNLWIILSMEYFKYSQHVHSIFEFIVLAIAWSGILL